MAKQRGKGEGTITVKKGRKSPYRWRITIRGKTYEGYCRTRREAVAKIADISKRSSALGASAAPRATVQEFMSTYVERELRPHKSASHTERTACLGRNQIYPLIGHKLLSKLTADDIEDFYHDLLDQHSTSNAHKASVALTSMLNYAVQKKVIAANPAIGVTKPQHEPNQGEGVQYWTEEEISKFLEVAREYRLFGLFATALGTGMRQGELYALRWRDVDFEAKTIAVRRTLREVKGRFEFAQTKRKSNRVIKIGDATVEALENHRREMEVEGHRGELVFVSTTGTELRKSSVERWSWKPARDRSGVTAIVFHDLRHTHATQLLFRDIGIKVVSERLGHKNVEITLKIYAHVLPGQDQTAADAIDSVLSS